MRRQLGQLRPANTSAASAFTPAVSGQYSVNLINIANVSEAPVDVSVFHDKDGTTYDQTTALLYTHTLAIGGAIQLEADFADYLAAGNLGVQSSVANAATFTLYGEIEGEQL
jgi:hypothetical protein